MSVYQYLKDIIQFRKTSPLFYLFWINELCYPKEIGDLILKFGGEHTKKYGDNTIITGQNVSITIMCDTCFEENEIEICRNITRFGVRGFMDTRCLHLNNPLKHLLCYGRDMQTVNCCGVNGCKKKEYTGRKIKRTKM